MKKIFQNRLFKIFVFIVLFFGIERFCYHQTKGFRVDKVYSDIPYVHQENTLTFPTCEEEQAILPFLDKPFYFLGKGVQSYVFVSQDGSVVLKLFKHHHFWLPSKIIRSLILPTSLEPLRSNILFEREKRVFSILRSCHIAYSRCKEETGVLYIHLQKTDHLKRSLTLVDNLGIAHHFDADLLEFAVQLKADLVYDHFHKLMQHNDIKGAHESIDSIIDLIVKRSQNGIVNSDALIRRNFGFIGNRAVEIDIGSYGLNPHLTKPYLTRRELFFETLELKDWLVEHYPTLSEHFEQKLASVL